MTVPVHRSSLSIAGKPRRPYHRQTAQVLNTPHNKNWSFLKRIFRFTIV